MTRVRALILTSCALPILYVQVAAQVHQQSPVSIQDFFRGLVEHHKRGAPAKDEDLLAVADGVPAATPKDISDALPWIQSALSDRDHTVQAYAAFILMTVARRQDGVDLLRPYLRSISNLLNSPNDRLQGMAVNILASLRPEPPPQVLPVLLEFVKQTDRDPNAQVVALSLALRMAPEQFEVITAVDILWSRPVSSQVRESVLNAIANSRTKDAHLVELVITALSDSAEEVRFTAAQALWRMGKDAILRARPVLQDLLQRPDESAQVKTAAAQALRVLDQH
jgi:HEAT repeat protein